MVKFSKYVEIGEPVSPAEGIAKGMMRAAEKNDKIIAVSADLGIPGMAWFAKNAPDRIVECGIAEANAAVVAAGLAVEGFIPFISGFVFSSICRAYNQIRQSILVDRFNVKIMAREGAWGEMGVSHNYVEGIAATRVMPNLVIVNPADIIEAEKSVLAIADYIGPVFLRLEAGFAGGTEATVPAGQPRTTRGLDHRLRRAGAGVGRQLGHRDRQAGARPGLPVSEEVPEPRRRVRLHDGPRHRQHEGRDRRRCGHAGADEKV